MKENIIIEHEQWGRENGMRLVFAQEPYRGWERIEDGRLIRCFESAGWREVPKTKWVSVTREIQREGKTLVAWVNEPETYPMHFHLGKGYRWAKVEIEKEVEI